MSSKVVLIDDLETGEVPADGTISFAVEGTAYEIDLTRKNREKLLAVLGPYMAAARRKGSVAHRKPASKKPASNPPARTTGSEQLQAIREWARKNGKEVSDRGRIPNDIVTAFEEAMGSSPKFSAVPQ